MIVKIINISVQTTKNKNLKDFNKLAAYCNEIQNRP